MSISGAFDVNATFPADPQCRVVVEAMVSQAAECAGCGPDLAKSFADEVGRAFATRAEGAAAGITVAVQVTRGADAIEASVTGRDTVRVTRPAPPAGPAA